MVFESKVKHIKGGIPLCGDILRHNTVGKAMAGQHFLLLGEEDSHRILEGEGHLTKLCDHVISQ
jgi:hypothetical protein